MQLYDALDCLAGTDHHDGGDLARLHDPQRFDGEDVAADRDRIRGHHFTGGQTHNVADPAHQPAKVAVGEDTDQPAAVVDHARHAEALVPHFVKNVRYLCTAPD